MGVIVKRPIANAAWQHAAKPTNDYHLEYWKRFQQLKYDFLNSEAAVNTALRFTLSQPGVSVAIVGASKPGRFKQNAKSVEAGALPSAVIEAIKGRWAEVATRSWIGQI